MNKSSVKAKQIKKYIDEHISEDLVLDEIADKFGISKHYLCHIYKKATGYTVFGYIKNKRLSLVKKYYASGMNLLTIAYLTGFKNYSSFYRTYRNEFGTAPSKSIELIGNNNE